MARRFASREELIDWLREPVRLGDAPMNRYLATLYESRLINESAFGDLRGDAATRYLCWAVAEFHLPPEFLPPPEGIEMLNAPASAGARWGINKLLEHIYLLRADLRREFPDLDGEDGRRFVAWVLRTGKAEHHLPDAVVSVAAEASDRGSPEPDGSRHEDAGVTGAEWGVNVLGFLTAQLGIGEATRLLADGLAAADVPVMRSPCGEALIGIREGASERGPAAEPDSDPYAFNLIGLNGPWLAAVRDELEPFAGRYTIGSWWWEIHDALPDEWLLGSLCVDEVWVASRHIAEGIRPFVPVPVNTIVLPLTPPKAPPMSRSELGLPDGYLFLFMFDVFSGLARKNPLGVIKAFRRAFPPGSGAQLVLKSINGGHATARRELVRGAAGGHPDIHLIDGLVSAQEKNAIVAACDCYVSLHRAEGFGLPLAEAMSLGKPVIATGYSGNLEFMDAENSYLVDAEVKRIGEETTFYSSSGTWAEPDLADAAAQMRRVFERPDEARALGRQAKSDIAERHSLKAAGESMLARLEQLAPRS